MRRRKSEAEQEQERADWMLHEWAGGYEAALGYGYPPVMTASGVQNGGATSTAPERYAHDQHRHERLDRAVRRVAEVDPRMRGIIWQVYIQRGASVAIMAEDMGMSERTWRRWRDAARVAFLRAFDGVAESA